MWTEQDTAKKMEIEKIKRMILADEHRTKEYIFTAVTLAHGGNEQLSGTLVDIMDGLVRIDRVYEGGAEARKFVHVSDIVSFEILIRKPGKK